MPRSPWWRGATFYQLYVRSFRDTNSDGFGDLRGALESLDYIESLGVDAIWFSPTMPSPDTDWGYDVSDYCQVHPELGTLEDLDRLVAEAGARGISVLLDLVPNHTSDRHPWFKDALSGPGAEHRDYYVWAVPKEGGKPPNNWLDATEQCAWTLDERSGQYYLHNFLPTQPDLNWWEPRVHQEFERILRFWFDRGIAGFRIDVAHGLYKDAELRDNPPGQPGDHPASLRGAFRPVYSSNRPEVHEVYRAWRQLADSYDPGRALLGETWEFNLDRLASFYGGEGPELHMAFNFPFFFSEFRAPALASVVERSLSALPPGSVPVWTASNHDAGRFPSRWCGGDTDATRAALVLLAALPGTLVLYYGDELGMRDVDVPPERQVDEMTMGRPERLARDRCRTPMPWSPAKNGGFTDETTSPWLPMGDHSTINVQAQEADPGSVLNFWRRLSILRKRGEVGGLSPLQRLFVDDQLWAFRTGENIVAANLSPSPATLRLAGHPDLHVVVSTHADKKDRARLDALVVAPWEALVLRP